MNKELPKRKPTRLKGYDYSLPSAYFVTICTQNREQLFEIENVGNNLRVVPSLQNAIIHKWLKETENKLIFENPQHDYPQKITYTKGTNNTLTAEISGKLQGKLTTERFIFVKK